MSRKWEPKSRIRQRALMKQAKDSYSEIPRKHVLAALDMIKSPSDRGSAHLRAKRRCEMSPMMRKGNPSISNQLLKAQRKAIFHHDWDTAINYLYFMLDHGKTLERVYFRQFLPILFNHPNVSPDDVNNFLSNALCLVSRREQHTFLAHMFYLRSDAGLRGAEEELELLESDEEFEYV
ncbi:Hypothetical protein NTJ_07738 [Nesidiocoris tenuis]|uniref:PIK helical domain-containing protein n=1 Tax=Nesidiocoris tenuis TaxID=355587 RepID=A0ABN7ARU5_9HEMI|nr:Hypothetical protein NTJ_07738 [Nesidiocoris tenuis]